MKKKYNLTISSHELAQPIPQEIVDAVHEAIYHKIHERFPLTFNTNPALSEFKVGLSPRKVSKLGLLLPYAAGVVTTPLWVYIFRRQLAKVLGPKLSDEELDEPLFKFMQARLDYQAQARKKDNDNPN